MLVEGSRGRSWDRIATDAEALGMDIVAFGGPEVIGLGIDALADDWCDALRWAAELALESTFPAERTAFVARQTAAELERLGEQGEVVAGWAHLEQLYGRHPWGRPLQGTEASLEQLGVADLERFHGESLGRGLIVSMVGDLDPDVVRAAAEAAFPGGRRGLPAGRVEAAIGSRGEREVAVPPGEQSHIYIGQLTIPIDHPDRVALEVAAVCLGAGPGLSGRIPERVREREGLAYVTSVGTAAGAGSEPGRLVVYLGTAVDGIERAVTAVTEELERLVADGIGNSELQEAVRFLSGSQPFRRETARQIALLHAQACLYGIPVDRPDWLGHELAALDRERVNEAIRRHIDPASLSRTIGIPRSA
jgi:zinc protease